MLSKNSCAISRRGLIFRRAAVKGANHTPMYSQGLISKATFPCFFGSCLNKISRRHLDCRRTWLDVRTKLLQRLSFCWWIKSTALECLWNFRTKERTLLQGIYDSNQYSCEYNAHVLLETGNTSFIECDQKGDLAVLMSFQDRPKS